ncbi:hypothetical protein BZG36_01147 [Bifiguratus adelaidae]|uniref:BHLH domain-containing protein n=1 Tax=Bifiguratus adelaidae TaxID=1938954 RepID=A0A261Y606_9FUNG|nr:hypothetical protein BZG36_01147 [Bifiguratus adelaidae]
MPSVAAEPKNALIGEMTLQYDSSTPSSRGSSPRSDVEIMPPSADPSGDEISDDDDEMLQIKHESGELPITNGPLFLNFTPDLNPQMMSKRKPKSRKQHSYKVNGVNILNRNSVDSKTAMERLKRRRENHNYIERRRRDNLNHTIFEIAELVPGAQQTGQKANKGNILRLALDHIKDLHAEIRRLKSLSLECDGSSGVAKKEIESMDVSHIGMSGSSATSQSPHAPTQPTSVPHQHAPMFVSAPQHGNYNQPHTLQPGQTLTPPNLSQPRTNSPHSLPNSPALHPINAPGNSQPSMSHSVPTSPNRNYFPQSEPLPGPAGGLPSMMIPPMPGHFSHQMQPHVLPGSPQGHAPASAPALGPHVHKVPSPMHNTLPSQAPSHQLPPPSNPGNRMIMSAPMASQHHMRPPHGQAVASPISPISPLGSQMQMHSTGLPPMHSMEARPFHASMRMAGSEQLYGGACRY